MTFDFDRPIERRGTNSIKWSRYDPDVLPLWVADMDFTAPAPVTEALRAKVEHGIFGYEMPSQALAETVAGRMHSLYGWQVAPEMVVATPGVIAGFSAAAHTVCAPRDGLLIQPPVYPPFVSLAEFTGLTRQLAPLRQVNEETHLHYEIDWPAFESGLHSNGARTRLFLLCSPHNPTGQVYSREELRRMGELCLREDVFICSDEIHSELLLGAATHTPIAALSPQIAARTITLVAPSKTFNIPGLFCAFAIIPDEALRTRYKQTVERMALHVNSLGLAAAGAAFSGQCDNWLTELRAYLTANRDFLAETIASDFPGIRTTRPDATYLAWLDCNQLVQAGKITTPPHKFFLEKARVALNDGKEFGSGGEGFVRLNFGCSRQTLVEALTRMKASLGI
jgi:cystathionine beta-lyase